MIYIYDIKHRHKTRSKMKDLWRVLGIQIYKNYGVTLEVCFTLVRPLQMYNKIKANTKTN